MTVSAAANPWGYLSICGMLLACWAVSFAFAHLRPAHETAISRLGCLDGIRGFLALTVMAHHFRIAWNWRVTGRWELPAEAVFSNLGPFGVILFFMITGFLFWRKLVMAKGRIDIVPLAVSRVFRIYPAYLLSLALIAFVSFLAASHVGPLPSSEAVDSLVSWLLFTGDPSVGFQGYGDARVINAGVTWTLQYEWIFYAILPLLGFVVAIAKPNGVVRIVALVISIVLISFGSFPPIGWFQIHIAVGFLYGCLAFEILQADALARAMCRPLATVASIGLVAMMLLSTRYPYDPLNYLLLAFPFTGIAAGNSLFGVLRSTAAVRLGDASYSVYLFHGIFVFVFFAMLPPTFLDRPLIWLFMPLLGIGVSVWALVCFRYVEEPAIRIGKSVVGGRRRVAATEEVAP